MQNTKYFYRKKFISYSTMDTKVENVMGKLL